MIHSPEFTSELLSLGQMPAVIEGFVTDLARCQSHADAVNLLVGLVKQDKALIFEACPKQLQQRLWAMKQESIAA